MNRWYGPAKYQKRAVSYNILKIFIITLIFYMNSVYAAEIVVSNASGLANAIVQTGNGGAKTILLEDGVYTLDDMLWVAASGVTVRSISGNREAVIIEGRGMWGSVSHIFNVAGSNFTVRDVTLRRVSAHAVQLQLDIDSVLIRNVHILDTCEQMVKVAYDPGNPSLSSDNGIMEHCLLEYTAGIGPQYYIGGIDAHNAKNWIVRDNIFIGIRSPGDEIAEHAIHFWSGSENTLVERNLIINCDRGIGFGLGYRGHTGGIIRNNMIYHDSSEGFADVGIGLESAVNAQVYNNTIFMEQSYLNAIEYRFTTTTGTFIANNITNKAITRREGAYAEVTNNVTHAEASWFVNPAEGDLHLSTAISDVVDQGQSISGLTDDFDGSSRPEGNSYDIGADEYINSGASKITDLKVFDTPLDNGGSITLTWSRNIEEDVSYYNVYRSLNSITDVSGLVIFSSPRINRFVDNKTADKTNYYYAVTAVDSSGNEDKEFISVGYAFSIDNLYY